MKKEKLDIYIQISNKLLERAYIEKSVDEALSEKVTSFALRSWVLVDDYKTYVYQYPDGWWNALKEKLGLPYKVKEISVTVRQTEFGPNVTHSGGFFIRGKHEY